MQKKNIFSRIEPSNLQLVAPSQWLADKCSQSTLLSKFPIKVIPYGLDLDDFAPRNKTFAQETLGIPEGVKVVMFIAHSMKTIRKNFTSIVEILPKLQKEFPIFLLTVGRKAEERVLDVPHRHLGYIGDDRILSLIYSAADVFLITSLQDNLPNTVMESLACGTPVAGFSVGGIAEMIENDVNGYLVPPMDTTALLDAITKLLHSDDRREKMAHACRQKAVRRYSDLDSARRYYECYATMNHGK
jgi:glycosyltransferase involved in cell wall biosynthesis